MDPIIVGVVGIVFMFVLMFLGLHIGVAMFITGFIGMVCIVNINAAMGLFKSIPFTNASNYGFTVIPLFVLMGQFCYYAGISSDLYSFSNKWLGRIPGGLSIATIGACAGFSAISGSSTATAATMGTVAIPEMKKHNYSNALATGCVAAGGTLGILIPPSIGFILYGILAQESIGKLFAAGFIPGILLALLYCLIIVVMVARNPKLGPKGPRFTLKEKLIAFKDVWAVLFLFLFIIGGIFLGWFSANEAAAMGAVLAFLFMIYKKQLTLSNFSAAVMSTIQTTGMIFLILIGTYVFGSFLAVSKIPLSLAAFVGGLDVSKYIILFGIVLVYLVLGCIMDSLPMVLLTTPIFLPIILDLGFNPIWYGVLMVMVMEQGLITPPVGMNVYVIGGVSKDVPLQTIFKGVFPFWWMVILAAVIITIFPQIALWLPGILY